MQPQHAPVEVHVVGDSGGCVRCSGLCLVEEVDGGVAEVGCDGFEVFDEPGCFAAGEGVPVNPLVRGDAGGPVGARTP